MSNKNEDRRVLAQAYVDTMNAAVRGKKEDIQWYRGMFIKLFGFAIGCFGTVYLYYNF